MTKDDRATRWSITVWMPPYTKETANDMINQAIQSHLGWSIEGQLEKGAETGKLHYQLMLKTTQVRHSAVRRAFPSCHVESARNSEALKNYVHKDETREGEFKTVENRYLTWTEVRKQFYQWIIRNNHHENSYMMDDEQRLQLWDTFIGTTIREGLESHLIGVNPQYRSAIIRYWNDDVYRHISIDVARQTDTETSSPASETNGTIGFDEEEGHSNDDETS